MSCALNWECDSALLIIIVPGQRIYRKENPLTSMARLFRHRRLECASSIFSRPLPTGETEQRPCTELTFAMSDALSVHSDVPLDQDLDYSDFTVSS